ncbi:MAG TPA: S-layer homology domain-containing protein [Acidimicrobiales bacterium]|nr:S-layer homology domain-containing protein [Acidimicrobiales bacterium]
MRILARSPRNVLARRLLVLVATLAIATTGLLGADTTVAEAQSSTASEMEHEFFTLLNDERTARGLAALDADSGMAGIAHDWSGVMSTTHLHHRPDLLEQVEARVTTEWTRIGENVGRGGSVATLHQAFMDSPTHYDNVVGRYNRLGVGVVLSGSTIWVTFNFLEGPALAETAAVSPTHPTFTDVAQDAYFYGAVDWAWKVSITTGTTDTTFSPNGGVTRAQAVTFLWRAAGSPTSGTHGFTDVVPGSYYDQAVAWASTAGITTGTSPTTFGPHLTVSRAQMVTFQWRAAGQPASGSHPFTDVEAGSYYEPAVAWAAEQGITTGATPTQFNPMSGVTRGQSVTFLWRAAGTPTV